MIIWQTWLELVISHMTLSSPSVLINLQSRDVYRSTWPIRYLYWYKIINIQYIIYYLRFRKWQTWNDDVSSVCTMTSKTGGIVHYIGNSHLVSAFKLTLQFYIVVDMNLFKRCTIFQSSVRCMRDWMCRSLNEESLSTRNWWKMLYVNLMIKVR